MRKNTALGTGASRGIGRAIVSRLAADSFRVLLHYVRIPPGGDRKRRRQKHPARSKQPPRHHFAKSSTAGVNLAVELLASFI